ncbi:MAG TPA: MFS transporter [Candidatus Binatia bacterium]|jgi:predicted MFS family arabinose efflux permease|nr:MFS transporter [Candidatus Binatia bacterium]
MMLQIPAAESKRLQSSPAHPVSEPAPAVGGLYAYYVLGMLFVVYIFNFIDRQILAILLQPIKEDLKISDTALGFLTGFAFAVFYTFAGLPLARLADRWVRRSLIALSLVTWSVMTAASGLARGFTDLALARIGVGIGEAGATPPAHSLLSDYFPPEKRATVLALYACGVPVGVGLGYWLGGWINDAFGWRVAFFVIGLPGVVMALLVRLTVREPVRGVSERQPLNAREYSIREVWRFFATLPAARHVSLAAAFHAFAGYGLAAWIPAFFVRIHHMTPGELGLWMSWITAVGGVLGSFLGGMIADHWVRSQPRARAYVSMIGALLTIPFLVASVLLADQRLALLSFLPATVFGTLWFGPAASIVQDLVPPAMRATASAVFIFILTIIGLGAGPQVIGILNDWIGTPDAIRYSLLYVAVVMNLLSVWFFWLTGKTLAEDLEAKKRL